MFEPLGQSEVEKRTGTYRGMRMVWAVVGVAVAAIILAFVA